jgi:adenylate cyclase
MGKAITRKFLVKVTPDLSSKIKTTYQRYYLYNKNSVVIRIQKINEDFELERKANVSGLVRDGQTVKITQDEFEELKKFATKNIKRDSYEIQKNPRILLRVYHGSFEGLTRVEVNFDSEEEANTFQPLDWFGKEITGTNLSQDGHLLTLTTEEFKSLLDS